MTAINVRTGRTHSLKVWPSFYEHIESGAKPFEVRRDDRGFLPGDALHLCEWDPATRDYTGRDCFRVVTYLLDLRAPMFGVEGDPPLVVLGLREWDDFHDGTRTRPVKNGSNDNPHESDGTPPEACTYCGDVWPCAGSQNGSDPSPERHK